MSARGDAGLAHYHAGRYSETVKYSQIVAGASRRACTNWPRFVAFRKPDPEIGGLLRAPDKDYVDRSSEQSLSRFRAVEEAWWCGEQATPARR
jgi:hypothetical protein